MAKQSKNTKESVTALPGAQKPSQPHDCFFKQSMEYLPIARDWLRANLPPALVEQMDLSTLELANREVILAGLQRLQNDCVYQCQINGNIGYIVALLEHQSTADKLMAFRELQYKVAIMDNHLKQEKPLPAVISVVLYVRPGKSLVMSAVQEDTARCAVTCTYQAMRSRKQLGVKRLGQCTSSENIRLLCKAGRRLQASMQ